MGLARAGVLTMALMTIPSILLEKTSTRVEVRYRRIILREKTPRKVITNRIPFQLCRDRQTVTVESPRD